MTGFDPLNKDPFIPEFHDSFPSLADSFFDFDSIEDWITETYPVKMPIDETQCPNEHDSKKVGFSEEHVELLVEELRRETGGENPSVDGSDTRMVEVGISEKLENMGSSIEEEIKKFKLLGEARRETERENPSVDGSDTRMVEGGVFEKLGNMCSSIEEEIKNVSLVGASESSYLDDCDKNFADPGGNGYLREDLVGLDVSGEKESDGFVKFVESVSGEKESDGSVKFFESVKKEAESEVNRDEAKLGASESSYLGDRDKVVADSGDNGYLREDLVGRDVSGGNESDGPGKFVESVKKETESEVNGDEASKVSLVTILSKAGFTDECGPESSDIVSDRDESDSSSDSDSVGSSSSSSSSSDEEEEEEEDREMGEVGEIEEGEIRDLNVEDIVGGTDDDDDDGGGGSARGPKFKNEVEMLPPVPPVDVALQSHHQTLPVGVVLSTMGAKVIVEGTEKHNPLSEGSILWITETRLPLGLVDEIFGPVKNPYYVVRYNSDKEVPAGIREGTPISFAMEFANHVLNDKNLYKKGYDASGENDEEVSDEAEFSDDEKEAEYKRMQRMAKRGADDRKHGKQEVTDRRKAQHRGGPWKNTRPPIPPAPVAVRQPSHVTNQLHAPSIGVPFGCGNCACSSGTGQGSAGGPSLVPPFSQLALTPQQFLMQSNGVDTNGMPFQPQQHTTFPNGLPVNGMPYWQQNHHQHPHQMLTSFQNGMPFQHHCAPTQGLLPGAFLPCAQPNFFAGPTSTPWLGPVDQGHFNQEQFGIGLQGHHAHPSINAGQQGVLSSGRRDETSGESAMLAPAAITGNADASQQFNPGSSSTRGGKPYRRGGGYFARGRGRRQYR